MTPGEAFERYRSLAGRIAGSYLKKLPGHIQTREVEQAALTGLWDAARRHHELPPEQFARIAAARISGAIVDEYRAQDPLPRVSRRGGGFLMIHVDAIEDLDAFGEYASPDPDMEGTIDRGHQPRWARLVAELLPEQQRLVMRRLLTGERQLEIGRSLGLTQARISQIVRAATLEMRRKLQFLQKNS